MREEQMALYEGSEETMEEVKNEGMSDFDIMLKDKNIQSEFDRRISKALETARSKWEVEAQERENRAKIEGERLARMSEDERAEADLSMRRAELDRRERDIAIREMRAEAVAIMRDKGLPEELAACLNLSDATHMRESVTQVERAFRLAVEAGILARMCGDMPQAGAGCLNTDDMADDEYYSLGMRR